MEAASIDSGRGPGILKRTSRALGDKLLPIFAGLAILYMLIPIAVIAVFSFNDPQGRYNFEWVGFTTEHWANAFGIPELTSSLLTSLQLAAVATVISAVLGTMIAIALVRYEFYGRKPTNFLIVIPLATPEVVIGAGLLSMFISFSFPLGFVTLLIAHVMFCISFVVVVVRSRLIGFDRSLEEAARDLGATPFQTFRLITLPLIAPGIVSGALLAFALSIDDFVISSFLSSGASSETVPVRIYSAVRASSSPALNALATTMVALSFIALGVALFALSAWRHRHGDRAGLRSALGDVTQMEL